MSISDIYARNYRNGSLYNKNWIPLNTSAYTDLEIGLLDGNNYVIFIKFTISEEIAPALAFRFSMKGVGYESDDYIWNYKIFVTGSNQSKDYVNADINTPGDGQVILDIPKPTDKDNCRATTFTISKDGGFAPGTHYMAFWRAQNVGALLHWANSSSDSADYSDITIAEPVIEDKTGISDIYAKNFRNGEEYYRWTPLGSSRTDMTIGLLNNENYVLMIKFTVNKVTLPSVTFRFRMNEANAYPGKYAWNYKFLVPNSGQSETYKNADSTVTGDGTVILNTSAWGLTTFTIGSSGSGKDLTTPLAPFAPGTHYVMFWRAHDVSTALLWAGSSFDPEYYSDVTLTEATVTDIPGLAYIDSSSTFEPYQIFIDNGSTWDLYIPYIDNGSTWELYS